MHIKFVVVASQRSGKRQRWVAPPEAMKLNRSTYLMHINAFALKGLHPHFTARLCRATRSWRMPMFSKILIATDGSWLAECAARVAVGLAKGNGGPLLALCVARPGPVRPTGMETRADLDAAVSSAHQAAIGHAERVAGYAHEAGIPCKAVTAISACPADAIIHAAEQNACELIVLGAHGSGALGQPWREALPSKYLLILQSPS
jgi:nucleotide-binding universal stress UspA family protein